MQRLLMLERERNFQCRIGFSIATYETIEMAMAKSTQSRLSSTESG